MQKNLPIFGGTAGGYRKEIRWIAAVHQSVSEISYYLCEISPIGVDYKMIELIT